MTAQDVFLIVIIGLVLLAVLVVFPAVWSSKPARRKAALTVLERILRWRGLLPSADPPGFVRPCGKVPAGTELTATVQT